MTRKGQTESKNKKIKSEIGPRARRGEKESILAVAARRLQPGEGVASSVREEQSEPKACLSLSYGLPCAAQVTLSVQLELC